MSNRKFYLFGIIYLVFSLIYCFSVSAQVNIFTGETLKKMQLKPGLYNTVNLDLAYKTGNTDLLTLRSRFRSDYLSKTYHTFVFGSLQQGRNNGVFFTNKGMAHGRIIQKITNTIMVESFIQKQFNNSILLKDRNLFGGGVRIAGKSQKSNSNIYLGTGAMWEYERFEDDITTRIVRLTNYINWSAHIDDRIITSATGYYQVHVKRFEDYRILFQGNVTFKVTDQLSFPIRVDFRYDNEPPTAIRKHDMEIFNGISYTF